MWQKGQRIEPADIEALRHVEQMARQLEEMERRNADILPQIKKLSEQIWESLRNPWRM